MELHVHVEPGDLTDRAGPDQFQQPEVGGVVPVVEAFEDHESVRVRLCGNQPGLRRVAGERLLRQHVLTRTQRFQVPARMLAVRARVVHQLDLRVGKQFLVGAVRPCDAVFGGVGLSPAQVAGGDGERGLADV